MLLVSLVTIRVKPAKGRTLLTVFIVTLQPIEPLQRTNAFVMITILMEEALKFA